MLLSTHCPLDHLEYESKQEDDAASNAQLGQPTPSVTRLIINSNYRGPKTYLLEAPNTPHCARCSSAPLRPCSVLLVPKYFTSTTSDSLFAVHSDLGR
jgi:hypothetical protein